MIAALNAGGSVIGVLADSLLKTATKPQYRAALQEGRLLLITPYYPEAGFHPGAAMGRNKYIYLLSTGVVVAKSGEDGGTWEGAKQNLKKQWVPLWVRDLKNGGNQKLIELGGQPLSEINVYFTELKSSFSFESIASNQAKESNQLKQAIQYYISTKDMFGSSAPNDIEEKSDLKENPDLEIMPKPDEREIRSKEQILEQKVEQEDEQNVMASESLPQESLGVFLDVFYEELQQQKEQTYIPKALAEEFPELSEAIIKQWLKTLEEQGLVKRQGKKLAYTLIAK